MAGWEVSFEFSALCTQPFILDCRVFFRLIETAQVTMSFFGSQLVFQVKIKLERFFKDKGILGKQNKYAVSVKLTGDRHFNALQHLCGSLLDHVRIQETWV